MAKELAQYNIDVLLVEPGAFRTNFLSAFKTNSLAHLGEYETAKMTAKVFNSFQGKQRGDPCKAAQCIVEAVSGQGKAGGLKGKVLRLPLGPDCVARLEGKIRSLTTDLEETRAVAESTDIV